PPRPPHQFSDPMPDQSLPWSKALVGVPVAHSRSQRGLRRRLPRIHMPTVSIQSSFLHPVFRSNEQNDIDSIRVFPRFAYRTGENLCEMLHISDPAATAPDTAVATSPRISA